MHEKKSYGVQKIQKSTGGTLFTENGKNQKSDQKPQNRSN
jgi:hypothetical protein